MLNTVLIIAKQPPGYCFTQTESYLGPTVLHKRTATPTSHFASVRSLMSRSNVSKPNLSKPKLLEK